MRESLDFDPLYQIAECPQLMSDAYLCDEAGTVIFLSVWGRDTAIRELQGRLTLNPGEDGSLRALRLLDQSDDGVLVNFGSLEMLEQRMTRAFRKTLFGSMIHLWLFDKRCVYPDTANATALAVMPRQAQDRVERLWRLTRETCPLPLLDHWRDCVLTLLTTQKMLSPLPIGQGRLEGYRFALDVPALTVALGELIRADELGIGQSDSFSQPALQRAA